MPLAKKNQTGKTSSIVLCICGMAGSGKSTLAKRIAEKYHLRYYSGGDALMALALEQGYSARERGWWESKEGLRFLKQRGKNPKFDKAIDHKELEMAEEGNVVLDSWTMPWLLKKGFKIWLEASTEKRAERIAKRDQTNFDEALQALKQKEAQTRAIYAKMYGFSLGEDYSPFTFILDTETLSAEEVFQVLCMVIERIVLK
jgi:cytidylate kinase